MAGRKKDKWLDTFCPEDACLAEEERFDAPKAQAKDQDKAKDNQVNEEDKDTWLEIFCPEASCEIEEPTQLP